MPLPVNTNYTRRPRGGDPICQEISRLPTGFLVRDYFPADDNGDRIVYQGLILAEVEGGVAASSMTASQPYYVPYSPTAAYGTGSDTAVGILAEMHDLTVTDWQVSPVDRGIAYEQRCYVGGGPLGVVPSAVKTDLSGITWR